MRLMGCGARRDEPPTGTVHEQTRSLVLGLDRHEAHVRSLYGFADRHRVSGVVLALLAAHAIGCDEFRRHQAHRVTVGLEQACPVVHARAGLHADHTRRQRRDQPVQLGSGDLRLAQFGRSCLVHPVDRKNILGQIDANVQNAHDFPFRMS
jgi:hypothetical protein